MDALRKIAVRTFKVVKLVIVAKTISDVSLLDWEIRLGGNHSTSKPIFIKVQDRVAACNSERRSNEKSD